MKNWHFFILGVVLGIGTIFSCATTGFVWPYYATQMPSTCYDQGTLLGPVSSTWPDLPLNTCKPDPEPTPGTPTPMPSPVRLKCITLKVDHFYAAKADNEKCHADLISCQKSCPSQ